LRIKENKHTLKLSLKIEREKKKRRREEERNTDFSLKNKTERRWKRSSIE